MKLYLVKKTVFSSLVAAIFSLFVVTPSLADSFQTLACPPPFNAKDYQSVISIFSGFSNATYGIQLNLTRMSELANPAYAKLMPSPLQHIASQYEYQAHLSMINDAGTLYRPELQPETNAFIKGVLNTTFLGLDGTSISTTSYDGTNYDLADALVRSTTAYNAISEATGKLWACFATPPLPSQVDSSATTNFWLKACAADMYTICTIGWSAQQCAWMKSHRPTLKWWCDLQFVHDCQNNLSMHRVPCKTRYGY